MVGSGFLWYAIDGWCIASEIRTIQLYYSGSPLDVPLGCVLCLLSCSFGFRGFFPGFLLCLTDSRSRLQMEGGGSRE